MYCQHHDIGNLIHLPSPVFIGASLSEPHHHVTMLMAFLCLCMYVCMYMYCMYVCITCTVVIPYCVLIQTSAHRHTVQCHTHCLKLQLFSNMDSGDVGTAKEKRQ